MMIDERQGNEVSILRTSVPDDLSRAIDALDRGGISYRVESEITGGWKFPHRLLVVLVDGWNEATALDVVADIPTEHEMPIPSDGHVERSTASLARVHTFAFIAAIVILLAGFLWQKFS
jgi:hypothetical protein